MPIIQLHSLFFLIPEATSTCSKLRTVSFLYWLRTRRSYWHSLAVVLHWLSRILQSTSSAEMLWCIHPHSFCGTVSFVFATLLNGSENYIFRIVSCFHSLCIWNRANALLEKLAESVRAFCFYSCDSRQFQNSIICFIVYMYNMQVVHLHRNFSKEYIARINIMLGKNLLPRHTHTFICSGRDKWLRINKTNSKHFEYKGYYLRSVYCSAFLFALYSWFIFHSSQKDGVVIACQHKTNEK